MDKIKLSHSKAQKYLFCPKQYELHYEQKIRSRILGSPLFFGLACDEAINRLLLDLKDGNLTEEEEGTIEKTPLELFDFHMKNANINGKDIKILDYPHIQFSKADFDISLLSDDDIVELGEDRKYWTDLVSWYYTELRSKNPKITEEETVEFNRINWLSLYRKGEMIIEKYKEEILPQIDKVYAIQKPVSLPNEDGHEIIGFIDFICSFKNDPEVKYIVDNKSSSKAYKMSDLEESEQLHTYAESEGLDHIAYIVYEKNIRKREPRVRINILKGKINEEIMEVVFDNYEKVLYGISQKDFKPNFQSGCFQFGRTCAYYGICHHGNMPDHLEKIEKDS